MSALERCHGCGEGVMLHHEDEPVPRCGNCGAPPLVAGGQGRPASEVWTTGLGCAWIAAIVLAACLVGLVALAAGWWAS